MLTARQRPRGAADPRACARRWRSRPSGWPSACALERGRLPDVLDAWRERGLLDERDGRARLTEAGFLLSDALFTELL